MAASLQNRQRITTTSLSNWRHLTYKAIQSNRYRSEILGFCDRQTARKKWRGILVQSWQQLRANNVIMLTEDPHSFKLHMLHFTFPLRCKTLMDLETVFPIFGQSKKSLYYI